MEQDNKIILFQENTVRRLWHDGRWHFSVSDIIGILTDSKDAKAYWRQLKKREPQLVTVCHGLKLMSNDGKQRVEDCASTEGVFRIIQSVPSPKAEPFKLWLAQVGQERLEEIENPEIAIERIKEIYKAKGYSDEWIESRIKSIGIRKELTDQWKKRGVKEGSEYSILTAEIAKATFGVTPSEHKSLKGLDTQNLRDHMTNLELIFTMLGEEVTRNLTVQTDAKGFNENLDTAIQGGQLAGKARRNLEEDGRVKVVSSENFLKQIEEAEKNNSLPADSATNNAEE